MQTNTGRGLGDHPIVVIAGLIAALIGIFVFVTGKENLPDLVATKTSPLPEVASDKGDVSRSTPASHPLVPHFQTISLEAWSELKSPETNLGLAPGQKQLLGVPFEIGWKASTQCSHLPNQPASFRWNVEIPHSVDVYLLIQAGWGLAEYSGKRIGNIRLIFSDGSTFDTPLVLGLNIRDWAWTSSAAVNTTSSQTSQPAWEGNAPDGTPGGIDLLTVHIPDNLSTSTLVGIELSDDSQATTGEINPCIHLVSLTVKYLS